MYEIVYSKRGDPLSTRTDDIDHARRLAESLRRVGYGVDVWVHTEAGVSPLDI